MWKLFITVLAMSDTGSISTSVAVTDYPDRPSCEFAKNDISLGSPATTRIGTHEITIRTVGYCKPGDVISDGQRQIPPPIAGMLRGFIQGMGEVR